MTLLGGGLREHPAQSQYGFPDSGDGAPPAPQSLRVRSAPEGACHSSQVSIRLATEQAPWSRLSARNTHEETVEFGSVLSAHSPGPCCCTWGASHGLPGSRHGSVTLVSLTGCHCLARVCRAPALLWSAVKPHGGRVLVLLAVKDAGNRELMALHLLPYPQRLPSSAKQVQARQEWDTGVQSSMPRWRRLSISPG